MQVTETPYPGSGNGAPAFERRDERWCDVEAFMMLVVVLVVFGPLLVIVPGVLILCAIGLFSGDGPRRARATFECPVRRSRVTADFAVPVGAAKPGSVTACSAFQDPSRVTCAQRCLEAADVRWTPPVGLFGRWALMSDGVVGADGGQVSASRLAG
jgi:hypothetical protein